ncbi:hypothetical protein VB776_08540 [Arcicella sp. DC2W]|uniref:Plasmid mobilization relaxosome protein MobC n=1 Tax=Arcicella gelida TaxID=2984195 RepID=A0ABU5S3A6_9BACT|nr:mobilization protein BmgB [Arcicella sp. DC2W]MEA5402959.1 hypothetical protein [Arcicella sp. DC2W]
MESKKPKQSGRPRLEAALQCVIPARFTQTEFEEIKQKSKGLKISRSAYIRSMTLKGKVLNLFTEEEQKAKKQLIGIANNLNQLLKLSHIHGIEKMIKQVNLQLGNIDKILDKYNHGGSSE